MTEKKPVSATRTILDGIAWSSAAEVIQAAVAFAAMLILVRIIPASDYGRAGAVLAWLALINSFNCSQFMAHALQLSPDNDPDWSLHWRAGLWIQFALFVITEAWAAACWFFPSYRPAAGLLHVAGFSLLLDVPSRLNMTWLRRRLDFRRIRAIQTLGALLGTAVTFIFAFQHEGAWGILLGGGITTTALCAADLLLVRRWRPPATVMMRRTDWKAYAPSLVFGSQLNASAVLHMIRGAVEGFIVPRFFGFEAMGLLNRSVALYNTTVGRVRAMLLDLVYPLLPRYAGSDRYGYVSSIFAECILLLTVPTSVVFCASGPEISRVLYGRKWVAMDPIIAPGTIAAAALGLFTAFSFVLIGAGKVRVALYLDAVLATASISAGVVVAVMTRDLVEYSYSVAVALAVLVVGAAIVAWKIAGMRIRDILPALGCGVAACVVFPTMRLVDLSWTPLIVACIGSLLYLILYVVLLRVLFPHAIRRIVTLLPRSEFLLRGFGLEPSYE
jgi:O-antigen/teichoic acid export membrane protein